MVGIVLVSHSHSLAVAARELALGVSGGKASIAVAAGVGDDHADLGTNAVEIMEAIQSVMSDEGVLVLMDMGSAILSAETALSFLDESIRAKVRCSAAPFVEGAVIACATAGLGSNLDEVSRETEAALGQKVAHLQTGGNDASGESEIKGKGEMADARTVRVTVRNPHGLHARPAARFIREAAAQQSEMTVRNVTNSRGPVSARSLSGLASLEILQGNEIEIAASGSNAQTALSALKDAVESGLGESIEAPKQAMPAIQPSPIERTSSAPIPVSNGLAIGPIFFASKVEIVLPSDAASDPEVEVEKLRAAIERAKADLAREESELRSSIGSAEAEIFQAQALVLVDPELITATESIIRKKRQNAAHAWHHAIQRIVATYGELKDEYLRQRAADVRDIGARVLEGLGVTRPRVGDLPSPGLLVVEDLTPAEVTALPKTVLGVICLQGSTTSHAAILLRARGIPTIAQAQAAIGSDRDATREEFAAFDGDTGELWLNPDSAKLAELRELKEKRSRVAEEELRHRNEPAVTKDGYTIAVFANLGRAWEAANAAEQGAEGVGLFRTEFLFLDRAAAPTEEEQFVVLRELREIMGARPVVVRTLDIGGDKDVPYLGFPKEANPFLGVRGIRLCLQHRSLFEAHLRAILRAGHGGNFSLMFPMISELPELIEAKAVLEGVHRALNQEGIPHAWPIPVGIMVEVPSAAVLIDQLAPHADYFSIGTNDLTQYTLAADRGNAGLSRFHDALHPSVLRLIKQISASAHKHGKQVAVCGEAGADTVAALLFIGLGVEELSVSPARIPAIKAAIRKASKADLAVLTERVSLLTTSAEVRAYCE